MVVTVDAHTHLHVAQRRRYSRGSRVCGQGNGPRLSVGAAESTRALIAARVFQARQVAVEAARVSAVTRSFRGHDLDRMHKCRARSTGSDSNGGFAACCVARVRARLAKCMQFTWPLNITLALLSPIWAWHSYREHDLSGETNTRTIHQQVYSARCVVAPTCGSCGKPTPCLRGQLACHSPSLVDAPTREPARRAPARSQGSAQHSIYGERRTRT